MQSPNAENRTTEIKLKRNDGSPFWVHGRPFCQASGAYGPRFAKPHALWRHCSQQARFRRQEQDKHQVLCDKTSAECSVIWYTSRAEEELWQVHNIWSHSFTDSHRANDYQHSHNDGRMKVLIDRNLYLRGITMSVHMQLFIVQFSECKLTETHF